MLPWFFLFLFVSLAFIENNIFFNWNNYLNIMLAPCAILVFRLYFASSNICLLIFMILHSWIVGFISGGYILTALFSSLLGFYILNLILTLKSLTTRFSLVLTVYTGWFLLAMYLERVMIVVTINFSFWQFSILNSYISTALVVFVILCFSRLKKPDYMTVNTLGNIRNGSN